MPHNRYVSIDYTKHGAAPGFDIALPDGIWDRAISQVPELEQSMQQLGQLGLAFLHQAEKPQAGMPTEPEPAITRDPDHVRLWPGRLRALDVIGRDERHFAAMTLNDVAGTLIADVPYAVQQPHTLRMRTFQGDGTPNGFVVEADIMLPQTATGPMLRRQAVTAMAEVSLAYGLQLDAGNKPSAIVDLIPGEVMDNQPLVSISPRPRASLSGEPLPDAPNVWRLTSEGLNNHEDPLVILAGLTAITTQPVDTYGANDLSRTGF